MESVQNENITCLQEIYKNTCDGLKAISTILPQIENEMLQKDLEQEMHTLRRIQMKAGRQLGTMGEEARGPNMLQSAGMKMGIAMRTAFHHESSHIAELMIHGNEMGIHELKRTLQESQNLEDSVKILATELLQAESDGQNMMKKYLNQKQ